MPSAVAELSAVLVTGATGRLGGTGRHVAAELLRRGLPVRTMVRRIDQRSEALRAMGIDVVVGDFADYTSLPAAVQGIEAAYFCYPVGAGLTEAAGLFAAAGLNRDLQRVVDLSFYAAFPESPSPQGRAQWVAERIFEWAGYGGTQLRVAAFSWRICSRLYARQVRELGQVRNSFGDFEPSWIAGSDVGAMPAAHLSAQSVALRRHSTHLVTDDIRRLTGRPAVTLKDFVERNRQSFMPSPDVAQ